MIRIQYYYHHLNTQHQISWWVVVVVAALDELLINKDVWYEVLMDEVSMKEMSMGEVLMNFVGVDVVDEVLLALLLLLQEAYEDQD